VKDVRVLAVTHPDVAWAAPAAGDYVRALAQTRALNNGHVEWAALQCGNGAVPLALPAGPQACWLTSLAATYGRALRDEIRREMTGAPALAARGLSHLLEAWLRLMRADHVVYANHLLFSTSLYGRWRGDGLEGALHALRAAYPDRAILWRSLNVADHANLIARMREAGARLLLSRVVWRVADPAAQWAPRTDVKADIALAERSGLRIDMPEALPAADLQRVLDLYRAIYLDKYSPANPDYTPEALRAAMETGTLRLVLVRAGTDEIVAFAADQVFGGELTGPLLGHDSSRPREEGLYRVAMSLSVRRALDEGLSVNYSAGAGAFKRHRGATPALEYAAVFDDHLPPWRRAGYAVLEAALNALTPALEKRALR
jgi:hypothetical protein